MIFFLEAPPSVLFLSIFYFLNWFTIILLFYYHFFHVLQEVHRWFYVRAHLHIWRGCFHHHHDCDNIPLCGLIIEMIMVIQFEIDYFKLQICILSSGFLLFSNYYFNPSCNLHKSIYTASHLRLRRHDILFHIIHQHHLT